MLRSRWSGRRGATAALAGVLALLPWLASRPAAAQCASAGSTVTCSGDDPEGFVAGPGVDDLEVIVESGATVGNGGADATPAIGVNDTSTVTNDGSISASGNGALGIDAGEQATVRNGAGATIEVSGGGNAGIRVGDFAGNAQSPGVTNEGTITLNDSDSVGIELEDSGFATNAVGGDIEVLGSGSAGMRGDFQASLTNAGTITVDGAGGAAMQATGNSSTLRSSGAITITGNAGVAMQADGADATLTNSDRIEINGNGGIAFRTGERGLVVNNDRNLDLDEVVISGVRGIAVLVGNDSQVRNNRAALMDVLGAGGQGVVGSDGVTLQNTGTLRVNGLSGVAVILESASSIENRPDGVIEALGDGGTALWLGALGGDGHLVNNEGLIMGGSGTGLAIDLSLSQDSDPADEAVNNSVFNFITGTIGSASGVAIRGGASKEVVGNAGTIIGSIDLGPGVDLVENVGILRGDVALGAGDDTYVASFAGTILRGTLDGGSGTDALTLGRELDTEGSGHFDLDIVTGFETLSFEAGGGVWAVGGSGCFVDGTTLAGGTLAVDSVVGLTTDYTQNAGATLEVDVRPDGTSGRLDISGAVDLASGARLRITESGGPVLDESVFTVLTYSGLTGEFELDVPSDSAFLSFSESYGPTALEILLDRAPYVSAAATPNQYSVANNLDEVLAAGATGDMAVVLAQIDLMSEGEFQTAADELSPEIYDAQTAVDLAIGDAFANLLEGRPLRCEETVYDKRDDVRMPAPCSPRGLSPWGALIGDFGDRDGGSQHVSYDWSSIGGALGLDARPGDPWLLSAELGGSYNWLGFGSLGGGNLATVELGAAATYLFDDRAHLRGILEYGHGWHTTRRDIDFLMRRTNGRHQSDRLMLVGEAAYAFPVPYRYGTLGIEPIGTVDYAYLSEGAVWEEGAGAADLDVEARSNAVVSTTLGARFYTQIFKYRFMGEYLEWADGIWRPEIDVRWREFWTGNDRALYARFQGAPADVGDFRVQAAYARRGAEVGAGVSFQPWKWRGTLAARYQAFVGDGSFVQQAVVGVRVPLP
jgi:hypothetical protein